MRRPLFAVLAVATLAALTSCGDDSETAPAAGSPSGSASGSASASAAATVPALSYNPTGTVLDTAFGSEGALSVALAPDAKDRFNAVAFGADDALYAAGLTSDGPDQEIAVARFDADGEPDADYGTDGVASVNVSPNPNSDPTAQLEQARSLVVLEDGSVIAVGTAEHDAAAEGDAAKDTDIVAVRFDADGAVDESFGEDGVARIDLGTGHADEENFVGADQGWGSDLLSDGGLVVFGSTTAGEDRPDNDFALLALTEDGALDEDFATDGVLTVDVGSESDSPKNVQVVDNQIVATGYARGADGVVAPMMIRTSLDGELDADFGTDGVASHRVLGAVAEAYDFAAQGDKYVLTGYGKDDADGTVDLIAYRFDADGALDETFGTDGVTRIDNVGQDDRGRNLLLLPDDRIVYAGSGKIDDLDQQAMLVVLSPDGQPDESVGDGGKILTDLGSNGDTWYGLALADDGETVYVAGYTNVAGDDTVGDDAVLARIVLS